jgi:hypothetical protein
MIGGSFDGKDHPMMQDTLEVSLELAKFLDEMVREPGMNRRAELLDLVHEEALPTNISACAWWDGCYYCRDGEGHWQMLRCIA